MTEQLFEDISQWAKETFPDAGPVEYIKKMQQEGYGVIEAPDDLEEYAECLIPLIGAASKSGFTFAQLIGETHIKLQEIKKRKWRKLPDGTHQHIEQ